MNIKYVGRKHCELIHGPSQSKIETDAPKDNNGLGEKFSPTDLVGAALASCMLTTMAIIGDKEGISIEGATCSVEKDMASNPRRIASLNTKIVLPARLNTEQRKRMEEIAKTCPVTRSLHPDLQIPLEFSYE